MSDENRQIESVTIDGVKYILWHDPWDMPRLLEITRSIAAKGWDGPPVLTWRTDGNAYINLTGCHRLFACALLRRPPQTKSFFSLCQQFLVWRDWPEGHTLKQWLRGMVRDLPEAVCKEYGIERTRRER